MSNPKLDQLANDNRWLRKVLLAHYNVAGVCFTFERMMMPGMANMFIKIREDLYPGDPEKQKELIKNHAVFYNTQPNLGAIVPGVVLGLEIERAKNNSIDNELIQSIKQALAGPFAGIGDSLIQGLLIPILLSIGISLSADGSPLGATLGVAVFFGINIPLVWFLFKTGVKMGISGAEKLMDSDLKDRAVNAIEMLGIIVIGAVVASTANVQTGLAITASGSTTSIQSVIDSILPGLLTILSTVLIYWLIKYKKGRAMRIMVAMFLISVLGYFTGILI